LQAERNIETLLQKMDMEYIKEMTKH